MKTESTVLASQKETRCREQKESWDIPWLFFWFSVVVLTYFFASFVSTAARLGVRYFFVAQPKIGAGTFSRVHIAVSNLQLTVINSSRLAANSLFPVFYPAPTALTAFSFEFLPPIRTCRFTADTFLFLTRTSLISLLKNTLSFSLGKEIFELNLLPFVQAVLWFIIIWKFFPIQKILLGKLVKNRGVDICNSRRIWLVFPTKLIVSTVLAEVWSLICLGESQWILSMLAIADMNGLSPCSLKL